MSDFARQAEELIALKAENEKLKAELAEAKAAAAKPVKAPEPEEVHVRHAPRRAEHK